MDVLFTGAGSIGSRHIKNLSDICNEKQIELHIDVLRYSDRLLPPEIKNLVDKEIRYDAELKDYYDVVFITDETKTHYLNIEKYKKMCRDMFIEKPILDSLDYDLSVLKPYEDSVYYVACPIRFSDYFKNIKEIVASENVYSARIIFSSYMPNWQKGRDYRKSFRCDTNRGGGVDIDSLHEIDYMTALFGTPISVKREAGHYSNLEMNACDIATYLFRYEDKLVEMHLDYFGRTNNRRIELYTKDDVIVIDYNKKTVCKELSGDTYQFGPDDHFYQNEMKYFVEMITGTRDNNINDVDNALISLKLAKGLV